MKPKHFLHFITLTAAIFVFSFFFSVSVSAQSNPPTGFTPSVNTSGTTLSSCAPGAEDCYTLLEELPSADGTPLKGIDTSATGDTGLGGFINFMFEIGLGIAGVLGVVMLTIYGFQYAAEDKNVATFSSLKTKITGVVLGLMLLLGIFVILRTINPDLLIVEPEISPVTFAGVDGGYNLGVRASSDNDIAWISTHGKMLALKKSSGGTVIAKACDASAMTTVNVFDKTFTVHKSVVASLQRIDRKWRDAGGQAFYKIPASSASASSMGAYNCRTAKGSSFISWHAYGLAVDINPAENPFTSRLKTNMPAAFVKMWTDEGWGWGGNWKSKKDAMHFSKISNEGGNMVVD